MPSLSLLRGSLLNALAAGAWAHKKDARCADRASSIQTKRRCDQLPGLTTMVRVGERLG
jgi:hypothetical protein